MNRIAVIGGRDSVLGFRALGLETCIAETGEHGRARTTVVDRTVFEALTAAAHGGDAAVRVVRGKRDMPQCPFTRCVCSICKNLEQSAAAVQHDAAPRAGTPAAGDRHAEQVTIERNRLLKFRLAPTFQGDMMNAANHLVSSPI